MILSLVMILSLISCLVIDIWFLYKRNHNNNNDTVKKYYDGIIIGCSFFVLACVACICRSRTRLRMLIRQDQDIRGSCMGDCLAHSFLPCCALVQDYEQVKFGRSVYCATPDETDSDT